MVIGSYPFTAKTVTKDLKDHTEDSKIGTQDDSKKGFTQDGVNPRHPNTAVVTEQEKSGESKQFSDPTDPGGSSPAPDDSRENECGERRSASNVAKEQELKKGEQGNNHSQVYDIMMGDGACGTIPHAKDDVQRIMSEQMPSSLSRVSFGDAVWNKYTGSFLNLNGLMAQISLDICARVRMMFTQQKASLEENTNRPKADELHKAATSRDGMENVIAQSSIQIKDDVFHTMFTQLMEQMCGQVMDMLKEMDGGGSSESDDEAEELIPDAPEEDGEQGRGDRPSITPGIVNPSDPCVTDQIMQNIAVMAENFSKEALEGAEKFMSDNNIAIPEVTANNIEKLGIEVDPCGGWGDIDIDTVVDFMNQTIDKLPDDEEDEDDGGNSGSSAANDMAGILSQLGSVTNLLQFSSLNKYAMTGAFTHNQTGNATQDERLREGGCRQERMYNTVQGAVAGMAGGSGMSGMGAGGPLGGLVGMLSGGSGGGSGGSDSEAEELIPDAPEGRSTGRGSTGDGSNDGLKNDRLNRIKGVGFGGLNGRKKPTYTTEVGECGDIEKVKCKKTDDEEVKFFKKVDYIFTNNIGRLRGEKTSTRY